MSHKESMEMKLTVRNVSVHDLKKTRCLRVQAIYVLEVFAGVKAVREMAYPRFSG